MRRALSTRVSLALSLTLAAAAFASAACAPEATEPSTGLPGDNPQVVPDAGSGSDGGATDAGRDGSSDGATARDARADG